MKKILLSIMAFASLGVSAQIYTCNDSLGFSTWTSYDNDNDGFEWSAANFTGSTNAFQAARGGCATSYSYDNGTTSALTPDNIFVSPAVSLTGAVGATLSWGAGSSETTASGWYQEHYAVYVITAAQIPGILAGTFPTPVYEGTLAAGETLETQSVNISTFAGQTIYIAVRHFDCTDEFILIFDDVQVTGQFSSVEEENTLTASAYPNPAVDVLNLSFNAQVQNVNIYSLNGQIIYTTAVNATTVELDVTTLAPGAYFYEAITSEGVRVRNTFIKK